MKQKTKLEDGEPCFVIDGAMDLTCCDCGLTHHITFGIMNQNEVHPLKGKICLRFYRDEFATNIYRKKKKKMSQ